MPTVLTKPVTRVTSCRDAGRNIVVTMNPAGFFEFRLKGTRKTWTYPISNTYKSAVWAEHAALTREKAKKKLVKRRGY